jgi:hypothetical protein
MSYRFEETIKDVIIVIIQDPVALQREIERYYINLNNCIYYIFKCT